MVEFQQIPNNLLVPFVAVEFDSRFSQQSAAVQSYRGLLVGQGLAAGSVAELTPKLISSESQARDFWGAGSQMHRMARAWFAQNEAVELWGISLDDAGGSAAATGTIAFAGTPTESGTVQVYVAGERYSVPVTTASTPTTLGDALEALITAAAASPVTASNTTGTVTLTAKNKGTQGNAIDLRLSYREGEKVPAGLTVTPTAFASGATDPVASSIWAALGDTQYHVIASGLNDSTSLDAFKSELDDRFGPLEQIEGQVLAGWSGTQAAAVSLGSGRNNKHETILPAKASPTPPWEWAAATAAAVALAGQIDPGRPFQTIELKGILAPAISDRYTLSERNVLLDNGMATFTVGRDGTVYIERLVTTYQTNAVGADDAAYQDLNTLLTLSYLRYSLRNRLLLRFPNAKLGKDGTRYKAGSNVVTPKSVRAEVISLFREWHEELALVEDPEQFKRDLIVQVNETDSNRLDILVPPNLINQLRVTAASVQFRI